MQATIRDAHRRTIDLLAKKGLDYGALRNALTPQRKKCELALFFDSAATCDDRYSQPIYERLLAAMPRKNFSCALLTGELYINDQDYGFELLRRGVTLHRPVQKFHHTGELMGVYINNLSRSRASTLRAQFEDWNAYVGYADCSYSSPVKDWMSTTLHTAYIKNGPVFIGPQEDDADADGDQNLPGWPLEEANYTLRSIPSMYFDMFLSYKIERRVIAGETDTGHSLSALSQHVEDLATLDILIEEKKFDFVTKHEGGLVTAGLADLTRADLKKQIRDKLANSYIYALDTNVYPGGPVDKFNVMLEFTSAKGLPYRILASLAYMPSCRTLRLLTLH